MGICFPFPLGKYLEVELLSHSVNMGFPGSSERKASACDVGYLGLIPGLGRSPRGGHGNPL